MKLASVLFIAVALALLVRRNLLQVDLTFPWFIAVILLGIASMSEAFIRQVAGLFGIVSDALVVILIAMGLLLGIITTLAIALSRLRQRQIKIIRQLAHRDLALQQSHFDRSSEPVAGRPEPSRGES